MFRIAFLNSRWVSPIARFALEPNCFRKQFAHLSCLERRQHKIAEDVQNLKQKYFHLGQWREGEAMNVYMSQALERASKYVASVELSADEKRQFKLIKHWYHTQYQPQASNLMPFIKLEAIGRIFEEYGGNYLTEQQRNLYLQEGVLGPVHIKTLKEPHLKAISDKCHNFHKSHDRNLGSVCAMLQNKCFLDLATNQEILMKVSSILGKNIMLSNFTINELAPNMGKSTLETQGIVDSLNCHSDLSSGSQYHFEVGTNSIRNLALDNRCVHVWVSISGTSPENAPLYFFPKTHHWEITTPFTHIDNAKNDPARLDHILKLLSFKQGSAVRRIGLYNVEYEYLASSQYSTQLSSIKRTDIFTRPGDCIFFNAHTRHGSGFNASSRSRLAVTLRFNTAMTEAGGMETAGSVATIAERRLLGIANDQRRPMIQVMGNEHHANNLPIDIARLNLL